MLTKTHLTNMAEQLTGNILIAQCGNRAPVSNASLAGIIEEALNHDCIEEIYGSLNGAHGIHQEAFIDLAEESQQTIRNLRHTPTAALGTSSGKLTAQELENVIAIFNTHNIRYFFVIGDHSAQTLADQVARQAQDQGYDLRTMGVPSTANNTLPITDHCPGYASAAKFFASTLCEMAHTQASQPAQATVSILEIPEHHNNWLTASSTLAKRKNQTEDAPHLVYFSEVPFSPEKFLQDVQATIKKLGYCTIAANETLIDRDGNYLTQGSTDAEAASRLAPSTAQYLAHLVSEHLGVTTTWSRPSLTAFASRHHISQTDAQEAYGAGQAAVRSAIQGENAKMIILTRGETDHYSCEYGVTALTEVINNNKFLPEAWINEDGTSLNFQYVKYMQPLLQGEMVIPYENHIHQVAHLSKRTIEKRSSQTVR
ncbi:MAG TPA: 6-phosphofructokinase [Opitutae bacterium]|nr:6-phosphofructokinase [Opitutae bacterium]